MDCGCAEGYQLYKEAAHGTMRNCNHLKMPSPSNVQENLTNTDRALYPSCLVISCWTAGSFLQCSEKHGKLPCERLLKVNSA